MTTPRILVAGIGNIFLGDDAFGVEVAWRMSRRALPDHVRVADFGIRGMDLAYALLDGYDAAILVDAVARGGDPGTLYVIEPESPDLPDLPHLDDSEDRPVPALVDAHGMNPMRVLDMARAMEGRPTRVLVVGCEPATLGDEIEGAMGLSAPVEAAVAGAIAMVESLVSRITEELQAGAPA
jgi:hydrogenase maturation protease